MKAGKLQFEFAPGARRMGLRGTVLLALGLVAIGLAGHELGSAWMDGEAQARRLAAQEGRSGPSAAPRAASRGTADPLRLQAVRQTSRNLAAPWADLLDALEASSDGVALLAVEPSGSRRSISLTAETATTAAMVDYLRKLQNDARLADVVLVSHQLQLQVPGTPVRFQLRASWGDAP